MNGLYIGATGMLNYMQHINVHSNNITNASTVGFKFDTMTSSVYTTHDTYVHSHNGSYGIGTMDNKVVPTETHVNLVQGSTTITNSQFDFYLDDKVEGNTSFFVVEKGGELFLTRNGSFSINDEGFLITSMGDFVLDADNQRIQFSSSGDIAVDINGRIFDEERNQLTHLQTRTLDSEMANALIKQSDTRFTPDGINITDLPEGTAQVHNGILEASNVNMASEMVSLLTNQKLVSASQRIMTTLDSIHEKEANSLL